MTLPSFFSSVGAFWRSSLDGGFQVFDFQVGVELGGLQVGVPQQSHLLGKIAAALNVSLEELMGTVTVKNEPIPKNRRLKRKLQMVETLPAQDQKAILRMIEAFVARRRMEKAS